MRGLVSVQMHHHPVCSKHQMFIYWVVLLCVTLSLPKGWMCRARKWHWLAPPQLSWMGFQASPAAPAAMTSQEWLRWRVWWRSTWLLIAKTCELLTLLATNNCSFPKNSSTGVHVCCLLYVVFTGKMSGSRIVLIQDGDLTVCLLFHHTAVVVKLFSTCCLMMYGSSWLAAWKSLFNVTGNAAPQVEMNFTVLHVFDLTYIDKCS